MKTTCINTERFRVPFEEKFFYTENINKKRKIEGKEKKTLRRTSVQSVRPRKEVWE